MRCLVMRRGVARLLRQHGGVRGGALDNPWLALAPGRALPAGTTSHKDVGLGTCHGYARDSRPMPMPAALPQADLPLPVLVTDTYGATSVVKEGDQVAKPNVYENIDGKRLDDGRYKEFTAQISGRGGREQVKLGGCLGFCRGGAWGGPSLAMRTAAGPARPLPLHALAAPRQLRNCAARLLLLHVPGSPPAAQASSPSHGSSQTP